MSQEPKHLPEPQGQLDEGATDFFISYTKADSQWAEWIAFELEAAGYTTVIQAWDSRPGMNFVRMMHEAASTSTRTLAVLSSAYLESEFGFAEWAVAFRRDPKGEHGKLLPVRIEECKVDGLLGPLVYIDLVGQDEAMALATLLAGVKQGRVKPASVSFPGGSSSQKSRPLTLERPSFPGSLPPIWNVPYQRNALFIGRAELLEQLAKALQTGQATLVSQPAHSSPLPKDAQLQTISGLGGIGKTQVALEYAYRYRGAYQAVLWVQAETRETLTASYLALAPELNIAAQEAQESEKVIKGMKEWLQRNRGYLLVLDNADDLALAQEFLPPQCAGHVLLTTRAQTMGRIARKLEVEVLPVEQGIEFLLRRAGILANGVSVERVSEQDQRVAYVIYEELGGLPLALDQAGAFIEETQSSLLEYQQLYREQRATLLKERGGLVSDHPEAVATTWAISFQRVGERNPGAADVLRACAFLAPDAIPETILTQGGEQLGPYIQEFSTDPFALKKAIAVLGAYSLVKRDADKHTLSVHRLVQAVMRDGMNEEEQRQWAKRVALAVNEVFPSSVEHKSWAECEALVPHGLQCAQWIEQYQIQQNEVARLLNQIASYLQARARYQEAESLYIRALAMREQILGKNHPDVAVILNNLAGLYGVQRKFADAQQLYEQVLSIYEEAYGSEHPDTATIINNLALLYTNWRRNEEAQKLYEQVLHIREKALGPEHPDTATTLDNMGTLYRMQKKYEQAEPLFERALHIREHALGSNHPTTVTTASNLAVLYREMKQYEKAEPLFQRVLRIRQETFGLQHVETANAISNLAFLYRLQGKYDQSLQLYEQALHIREEIFGVDSTRATITCLNIGELYHELHEYEKAEAFIKRALTTHEQQLGPEDERLAIILEKYAALCSDMGQKEAAESMQARMQAIRAKSVERKRLLSDGGNKNV